jgi:hypothetical protein
VAAVVNRNFVSVKVQMDSSAADNASVVRWYADARDIRLQYRVSAYPTLLFFNPEGKLVFRKMGYSGVADLVKTIGQALDPLSAQFFSELERYKEKSGDVSPSDSLARYASMLGQDSLARSIAREYIAPQPTDQLENPEKIRFVLTVARDRRLADSLFILYRGNDLDKMREADFFTPANIELCALFRKLMSSGDRFFRLCYEEPARVDSMLKITNAAAGARMMADSTIIREEVGAKVYAMAGEPDWAALKAGIAAKYKNVSAERLVLDFELRYYKGKKAWSDYTRVLVRRVEVYGPFGVVPDRDFNLNNLAWDVFQYSTDTTELKAALSWSDEAVRIVRSGAGKSNLANWMDTNANLLYKLARRDAAIREEEEALRLSPKAEDIKDNLNKMKTGQQTW